jgi:hypothetical protein
MVEAIAPTQPAQVEHTLGAWSRRTLRAVADVVVPGPTDGAP